MSVVWRPRRLLKAYDGSDAFIKEEFSAGSEGLVPYQLKALELGHD